MWFPHELWEIVKSYQLNYQISWHKKIKNVIKNIPKPDSSRNGPRIIFSNANKKFRFVKYLYHIPRFKNSMYSKINMIRILLLYIFHILINMVLVWD